MLPTFKSRLLKPLLFGAFLGMGILLQAQETKKLYKEFSLEVQSEYRYFFQEGLYTGQSRHFPSLSFTPELYLDWAEGKQLVKATGFLRIDRDRQRTHWDIRELYWQTVRPNWELSLGLKKVFWGVTESSHLVDIINQTDAVESFDGEQKLGQPMAHFSYLSRIGTFDLFAMPYFRKRQFPGERGRFRTPFLLTSENFQFESDAEEWHPDFAVRWSNSLGPFDVGLSYFYGTGREPVFLPDPGLENGFALIYPINHQPGLDVQATTGPILWKLETIYRHNSYQNMFASAAGLEYTIGNVGGSGLDIGLLAEYHYDNRDELALSGLDNDLFLGSRIALNDVQSTEILLGTIMDLNRTSRLYTLEASRRFGQNWKAEVEVRVLNNISQQEFLYMFRRDSFVKIGLSRFF